MNSSTFGLRPSHHPAWVYWSLAIVLGPIIGGLTIREPLGDVVTYIVNLFPNYPDRMYEGLPVLPVRALVHVAAPAIAAFLLLRFSRIGRLFAVTPLTLVFIVLADAFMLTNSAIYFREYFLDASPDARIYFSRFGSWTMPWIIGGGLGLLVGATVWYRMIATRPAWASKVRALFRPV